MKCLKKLGYIIIPVLILAAIVCCFNINITTLSAVGSSAKAMCVIEKDSGRILYCKNETEKLPMASTTKL